jgi:L-ribulose-5-phosphate 3-epimerase
MTAPLRLAAITDEFSPDLETAARAMADIGMTGAELRMVFGKNVVDLSDAELDRATGILRGHGLEIVSIASPLFKCVLPEAPPVDGRFQQDIFASQHSFEDQPRLAARTLEIARRTGARIVRVFSYWRTVRPERCFARVVEALDRLAADAGPLGIVIAIENEPACNVATSVEAACVLAALDRPNVRVVWDPANALMSGEEPYPHGYESIPPGRIAHVHVKDCRRTGDGLVWGPIGEGLVDWPGQLAALARDGYRGWLSVETHWTGPEGDKLQASLICGRALDRLAREARDAVRPGRVTCMVE